MSGSGEDRRRPDCPFCGAAWSDAMLAMFEAATDPNGCACCGSAGPVGGHDHGHHAPRPMPTEDLCCDACGRAIFRMPSSVSG
jgi:hypothetical protein